MYDVPTFQVVNEHDNPDNEINNSIEPENIDKIARRKPEKELKEMRKELKDKYHFVKVPKTSLQYTCLAVNSQYNHQRRNNK